MKEISLSSINKIQSIYERIKVLDADIIQIDKLGMLIAENGTDIKFTLSAVNPDEVKKEKSKAQFDEDGSLINPNVSSLGNSSFNWLMPSFITPNYAQATPDKNEGLSKSSINSSISEKSALSILGVVLRERQAERNTLLKKLESYGFKVS